jgi:antitoxin component of RelBE/YafQ-DinJ toxin-antitoxin module
MSATATVGKSKGQAKKSVKKTASANKTVLPEKQTLPNVDKPKAKAKVIATSAGATSASASAATPAATSASTATVTARVPREIKQQVEMALLRQGMTPTEAINRLYRFVAHNGAFPEDELPDPHAFPKPGERRLDKKKIEQLKSISAENKRKWDAFISLWNFRIEDWGEDLNKPYKQIIAEGRLADYEALSRH